MNKYPTHPQLRGFKCSSCAENSRRRRHIELWAVQKTAFYLHHRSVSTPTAVIPPAAVKFSRVSVTLVVDVVD